MFQETEAQKVIAISLGKIAISRSQRGGPKLFRNLLVANVIQKARFAAWDETAQRYRARYEQRSSHECETQPGNAVTKSPAEQLSLNCRKVDENNDSRKLSVTSRDALTSNAMDVTNISSVRWNEHNKENVLPAEDSTTDSVRNKEAFAGEKLYYRSAVSVPSRCVKRRSSTAEDQATKKARRDSLSTWRRNEDGDSDGLGLADDQMDLEQISNLVSVFSSSFKGLADSPKTAFYGDTGLRRGAPDVCSKQAGSVFTVRQSSLEGNSLPIVALTV